MFTFGLSRVAAWLGRTDAATNTMKIVHVVYSLEMGGAEMLVGQLCRLQRANGHEVSLCAYSNLGSVGEGLRAEGFDIYVPGRAAPGKTMRRYFDRFRALRPDVVHCHNVAPTLQAALGARLAGVRCVLSTRHSLVAPPYDRAAELKYSLMSRLCDRITGICEITCDNLRGAPLARKSSIERVYNGVAAIGNGVAAAGHGLADAQGVAMKPLKSGFTLLFVGRLAEVKDLGTLLRAFGLACRRREGLHLWIVGDGPARPALEALAAELGLGHQVTFWGERLDTAPFFSAADLFVMSSRSEGLPISLLQAMSAGLPAVLTDVGGMAEVLRLAESGVLVPVGDFAAMAEAIVQLVHDGPMRAVFSRHARATYEAEFTLETMDAQYMRLYETRWR